MLCHCSDVSLLLTYLLTNILEIEIWHIFLQLDEKSTSDVLQSSECPYTGSDALNRGILITSRMRSDNTA